MDFWEVFVDNTTAFVRDVEVGRGGSGGERGRGGGEGYADNVLEPGEVDGVDDFAVEEVEEEGFELGEAWMGVEELGGEVEHWFVAWSRFWRLIRYVSTRTHNGRKRR